MLDVPALNVNPELLVKFKVVFPPANKLTKLPFNEIVLDKLETLLKYPALML
jgi:hypothetical protein